MERNDAAERDLRDPRIRRPEPLPGPDEHLGCTSVACTFTPGGDNAGSGANSSLREGAHMASLEITRKEPVHFRVRATGPHPLPEYPFQLHLEIEYLDHPTAPRYLAITPSEFEEYAEAIEEEIVSKAV